jgi:uncharacterized tellurite resistance protein B-like protein
MRVDPPPIRRVNLVTMLDLIRKVIGSGTVAEPTTEADSARRTQIAASVILLEAAQADYECTKEEISHALDTIKSTFGLSREYAEELLELARQERAKAVDLWPFTSEINRNFNHGEKIAIMEAVWRIIYADGKLEKHEDHLAHKLAALLRLGHREMIDAKLKVSGQHGLKGKPGKGKKHGRH